MTHPTTPAKNINFISVLPGTGKTHWAINRILDNFLSKRTIIFYVAPTIHLIDQILGTELSNANEKRDPDCIARYNTSGRLDSPRVTAIHQTATSLGESVKTAIRDHLEGTRLTPRAVKGDCFFITHSGLLSTDEFPQNKHIEVIFDEAGHFMTQLGTLSIDKDSYDHIFCKYVKVHSVKVKTLTTRKDSLNPKYKWVTSDFRRVTIANKSYRKHTMILRQNENFAKMLDKAADPRYEVYVKGKSKDLNFQFFSVVAPARLFAAFKIVTVISAFFESTQMYHILNRSYNLVDRSYVVNQKRSQLVEGRYRDLRIYPLTDQPGVLSKQKLVHNILLTEDHVLQFEKVLKKHKNIPGKSRIKRVRLLHLVVYPVDPKSISAALHTDIQMLRKVTAAKPTLSHLMSMTREIRDLGNTSLCIVNSTGYLVNGRRVTFDSMVPNNSKMAHLLKGDVEHELISSRSHGSNAYRKHNALLFLIALNPNAVTKQFYNFYMPEYSYEEDWVVNTLAQCITRTSIRSPALSEPVHLVVPTMDMAQALQRKLKGLPVIKDDYMETQLDWYGTLSQEDADGQILLKASRRNSGRPALYSDADKKEVAHLRVAKHRLKKKIESSGLAKSAIRELQVKLEGVESRIQELMI